MTSKLGLTVFSKLDLTCFLKLDLASWLLLGCNDVKYNHLLPSLSIFYKIILQDIDGNYWVCGKTEEEARKNAAEKFKVSEDKISLKQGTVLSHRTNIRCYMYLVDIQELSCLSVCSPMLGFLTVIFDCKCYWSHDATYELQSNLSIKSFIIPLMS